MRYIFLLHLPMGDQWLLLIALLIIPLLILFFVFKAGQWYGQSKNKKQENIK